MKRLLKKALKPFWRMTAIVRRPVIRRIDARLNFMICQSIRGEILPPIRASLDHSNEVLRRLEGSINHANHSAQVLACDVDLMLGSVIREVARLQVQVDAIHDAIAQAEPHGRSPLALLETDEDGDPVTRPGGVERSKVG